MYVMQEDAVGVDEAFVEVDEAFVEVDECLVEVDEGFAGAAKVAPSRAHRKSSVFMISLMIG